MVKAEAAPLSFNTALQKPIGGVTHAPFTIYYTGCAFTSWGGKPPRYLTLFSFCGIISMWLVSSERGHQLPAKIGKKTFSGCEVMGVGGSIERTHCWTISLVKNGSASDSYDSSIIRMLKEVFTVNLQ